MKPLKMNQEKKIHYKTAKRILHNTILEDDFDNLHNPLFDTPFDPIQNRRYYITKVGRAGSIFYKGGFDEQKAKSGIFEVSVMYDFKHPKNFALNKNNITRTFRVVI